MTSTTFFDAPGGIRKEGNSQTLTFTRTSDTTGTLCWAPTPPTPSTGCGTPSGHYSGGLLVGSTSPIEQPNKPTDGVCCYKGDPTFDPLAFAGDMLGNARVLWSSNTDTKTGCVTVDGLDAKCTAYYFAFFAIDNVCRYNQDGIYSYSLNHGGPKIECVSGSQTILTNGADLTSEIPATVDRLINYPVTMVVDGKPLELVLRGSELTTYQSAIDELTSAWKHIVPPLESEYPPFYGQFLQLGERWYQHNGVKYNEVFPKLQSTDPTLAIDGDLWFDTTARVLREFTIALGWSQVEPVITHPTDPTIVANEEMWFDGTTVRWFDGAVWVPVTAVYSQSTDPKLAPTLTGTTVWKRDGEFLRWNTSRNKWIPATALVYAGDLAAIPNGTLWFDLSGNALRMWNGVDWIAQAATVATQAPINPTLNQVWVDPVARVVRRYNPLIPQWETISATFYHKQLDIEAAGDLHYDPVAETLAIYDAMTLSWVDITSTLFATALDPSLPPTIPLDAVWFNTTHSLWFINSECGWEGTQEVIHSAVDPRTITTGFWFNSATQLWYERDGLLWTALNPTISAIDPTIPTLGSTWFDGVTLYQRSTPTDWTAVPFETTPSVVDVGARWLDNAGTLHVWTGTQWDTVTPPYTVATTETDNIVITSAFCGSGSYIDITKETLFSALRFTLCTPRQGNDGTSGVPMYDELGVGTDGSVDERRKIIDNLYMRLGAPTINVELTRDQMDLAVQRGLDYIRRDSGAGYNRGYFFLDLQAGQQKYVLTSKAVGFHKIVDVLYLYRPRGGFLNSTFGGEIYGQQLMQQLYVSGTFDILSYHLLASYQTVVAKLFASEFQFQWVERTRTLTIMRKIPRAERILVDAVIERTEQDLLTDRTTKNWIENWALTEAKIMLGDMRGKYATLPGAGGAVTLNASELKTEAVALQEKLVRELDDYMASDVETWGLGGTIAKG